jgi:hypothetical protein
LAVYADRSDHEANQGDLFEEATLECSLGKTATVMMISHDCDCDKYLNPNTPLTESERYEWRVTVAIIHPISQLSGGRRKAAKEDKMSRYLVLPAEGNCEELVVDLWSEQPIRMAPLLECKRCASLSDEWRTKLWWKIIRLRLGAGYREILKGDPVSDAA